MSLFCKPATPAASQPAITALQALDAFADGMDRNAYVNKVLSEHVEKESHKTILRLRMLKGNPLFTESVGSRGETPA